MNPQDWQQQQQYDPSQEWPAAEPQQSDWDPTQYDANQYPGHEYEDAPHESGEVQPEYEGMPHDSVDVPMKHSSEDDDDDDDEEMGHSYLGHSLRFWQLLAFLGFAATIGVVVLACIMARNKEIKKAIATVLANKPSLHVENMSYQLQLNYGVSNEFRVVMEMSLENLATSTFQYIDATSSLYFRYKLVGVFNFDLPLPNVLRFSKMVVYRLERSPYENYYTTTTVKGTFLVKRMSKKARGYFSASVNCHLFKNLTHSCG